MVLGMLKGTVSIRSSTSLKLILTMVPIRFFVPLGFLSLALYGNSATITTPGHGVIPTQPLLPFRPRMSTPNSGKLNRPSRPSPPSSDRQYQGCQDEEIKDPLFQPQRVNGRTIAYTEEGTHDRFGSPIVSSSWEFMKGQQNEWDNHRAQVTIEQNVLNLQLALCTSMVETVNGFALWGLAPRCIKLSDFDWEPRWYGLCYKYYTRKFVFDVKFDTWDRDLLDEGNKVLNGKWDPVTGHWRLVAINGKSPNRFNPAHFIKATDKVGNPMHLILNGYGLPAGVCVDFFEGTSTPVSKQGTSYSYYYVSIVDNLGADPNVEGSAELSNPALWVKVTSLTPTLWNAHVTYPRGSLVNVLTGPGITGAHVYINKMRSHGHHPPTYPNVWVDLGAGDLIDGGYWEPDVQYLLGTYVRAKTLPAFYLSLSAGATGVQTGTGTGSGETTACHETTPGSIHVEKYNESDFLLLGIPIIF